MLKPHLTNEQVDMLEDIDGFIEWIEISGACSVQDVEYLQELIDKFGASISKSERERDAMDKACPWPEED